MAERVSAPEVPSATATADARAAEATSAGRGVLFIAFAKVYFMMAGASIELILPRLLGTAVFGSYRSMMQIVSPINNVLVTGTIQGVSKFTSEDDARAAGVQRAGLRAHLILGLLVSALYFAIGG